MISNDILQKARSILILKEFPGLQKLRIFLELPLVEKLWHDSVIQGG